MTRPLPQTLGASIEDFLADLGQLSFLPDERDAMTDPVTAMLSDRGRRYGPFVGHADVTQHLKKVMRAHKGWHSLTSDQEEALEMIVHKVGRIINGDPDYVDSWDDIAGYARLVADRLRGILR